MENIFYIANVLNGIQTFLTTFLVLSIGFTIACFIGTLVYTDAIYEDEVKMFKVFKKSFFISIIIIIISSLCMIFVPDKKTYLLMTGAKVVEQTIENNPTIKEIPINTLDLLNEYIKEETKKLKNND